MASSSRSGSPEPTAGDLVTIGRITAPHGLRGEVRVHPETDFPDRFAQVRTAFVVQGGRATPVVVSGSRPHGAAILVTLEGVADVDAARRLRGAAIAVPRGATVPLGPDTYYVHDLLGMRVESTDGRALGVIDEIMRGPAHDVYVVRGGAGEVLVPAVREMVRRVDAAARCVVVDLPEGLLPGGEERARAR
jgi:16S rRNA processing protein RimM